MDAALNWQDVLPLHKGDRVRATARGTWFYNINKNQSTGPDGPGDGERYLEGRVGQGRAFKVGSSASFVAEEDGMLQMRMNDSVRSDNEGHLDVTVSVSR